MITKKPTNKLSAIISLFFAGQLIFSSQLALADAPKVKTSTRGYAYISAGIGEEEVATMKQQAKNFSLNLWFSEGAVGRWADNVNVNIYDESSVLVFRIAGSRPSLYVNLPAGTYTILASNNGKKLRHKVTLEQGLNQKLILNWKDLVDEDVLQDGEGN